MRSGIGPRAPGGSNFPPPQRSQHTTCISLHHHRCSPSHHRRPSHTPETFRQKTKKVRLYREEKKSPVSWSWIFPSAASAPSPHTHTLSLAALCFLTLTPIVDSNLLILSLRETLCDTRGPVSLCFVLHRSQPFVSSLALAGSPSYHPWSFLGNSQTHPPLLRQPKPSADGTSSLRSLTDVFATAILRYNSTTHGGTHLSPSLLDRWPVQLSLCGLPARTRKRKGYAVFGYSRYGAIG